MPNKVTPVLLSGVVQLVRLHRQDAIVDHLLEEDWRYHYGVHRG